MRQSNIKSLRWDFVLNLKVKRRLIMTYWQACRRRCSRCGVSACWRQWQRPCDCVARLERRPPPVVASPAASTHASNALPHIVGSPSAPLAASCSAIPDTSPWTLSARQKNRKSLFSLWLCDSIQVIYTSTLWTVSSRNSLALIATIKSLKWKWNRIPVVLSFVQPQLSVLAWRFLLTSSVS